MSSVTLLWILKFARSPFFQSVDSYQLKKSYKIFKYIKFPGSSYAWAKDFLTIETPSLIDEALRVFVRTIVADSAHN